MVIIRLSQNWSLWLSLVFFPLLCLQWSLVCGYLQEIIFHERDSQDGNYFAFRSQVSDIFKYPVENVSRICWRGWWNFYRQANFEEFVVGRGSRSEVVCVSEPFHYRSFRYVGDRETKVDALSLYAGYLNEGDELLIKKGAYAGITRPIRSLGYTGKSSWTLFEGINFEGPSYCLPRPPEKFGYDESGNVTRDFGLTTIGSILKGCHKFNGGGGGEAGDDKRHIWSSKSDTLLYLQKLLSGSGTNNNHNYYRN